MPFLFSHVCDLFSTLESLHASLKPKSPPPQSSYKPHIASWFTYFRSDLPPDLWLPLFSLLWPEGRIDRVYGFKEDGLINAVSAVMCLGKGRAEELRNWRLGRGDKDLGECVERVFGMSENVVELSNAVTISEIEEVLNQLASHCRFSGADIRSIQKRKIAQSESHLNKARDLPIRQCLLGSIYLRLSSRDAKWFTRILLKSLLPVTLGPDNCFSEFHFLLPDIWGMRNDLRSALSLLGSKAFKLFPCKPRLEDELELKEAGCRILIPETGVKVGRPLFVKGLTCEGVLNMTRNAVWAVERKYDGGGYFKSLIAVTQAYAYRPTVEYCQIHVDLTKGEDWLTIFSKSGRNSTKDRARCHHIIRKCLRLDSPEKRMVKQRCILEAEFLVYSNEEGQLASFHTIKNHVTRAGTYIGTQEGGEKHTEHVMLKFFDCILLDDICTPNSSYNARRHYLEMLVDYIPNRAELVTRKIIDFTKANARELFFETFAEGIGMKWEGFVMKPCEGNYVGWGLKRGNFWIKLKKDYISGLGDSGDFVILGGRSGGKRGLERGLDPFTANTFYAACLMNKQDVISTSTKPIFKVVFTVSYNLSQADIAWLKSQQYFHGIEYSDNSELPYTLVDLDSHFPKPDYLFSLPLVAECFGGGFDKIDITDYWTLRWPRFKKLYRGRDYKDAVTFEELQDMAENATNISTCWTEEIKEWEETLKAKSKKKRSVHNEKSGQVKTTQLLTKCFWEADSPTTKRLNTSMIDLTSKSISAFEARYTALEPESPSERRAKRALSQISGNSMSQSQVSEAQDDVQTILTTSPLFEGQVYLMRCLLDKPEVDCLLSGLEINKGGCEELLSKEIAGGHTEGDENQKLLMLVEPRKSRETKLLLGKLGEITTKRRTTIEIYDWRILKRMKMLSKVEEKRETGGKKRKLTEDWSLMHIDTIDIGGR